MKTHGHIITLNKLNDVSAFTFKRKATKTDIRKAEQRIKLNEVPKSYTKIKLL